MSYLLTSKQLIVRNSDLSFTEMEGETVVINVEKGPYYGIDEIGTRICEPFETSLSVGSLFTKLIEEYDAYLETVQRICSHIWKNWRRRN